MNDKEYSKEDLTFGDIELLPEFDENWHFKLLGNIYELNAPAEIMAQRLMSEIDKLRFRNKELETLLDAPRSVSGCTVSIKVNLDRYRFLQTQRETSK